MLCNQHCAHFDQQDNYDKFYDSWLMVELECHKTIKAPSRRGAGTVTQSAADVNHNGKVMQYLLFRFTQP